MIVSQDKGTMDEETKTLFKTLGTSLKSIVDATKQNRNEFIQELPFFGIPKESDPRKNIIPLNEVSKFIKIINTQTDKNDFSEAGKINILKSGLLGPARDYWTSYSGHADFKVASQFLMDRYPDVQTYGSLLIKVNNLKRNSGEQISDYATKISDFYDRLQALHPGKSMSPGTVRSDSIQKLIEILPPAERKWIKIDDVGTNTYGEV